MFTVGTDTEFFLTNDAGKLVSAAGLIGGTKEEPLPVPDGALQEDGLLMEINIDPLELVSDNRSEFLRRIRSVTRRGEQMTGLQAIPEPLMEVPEEYHNTPEFLTLGCDPDRNLYTRTFNEAPNASVTFRTTGGHIHIGCEEPNPTVMSRWIRAIDAYAFQKYNDDQEKARRELYGDFGAFRVKPYGVESRVLSSSWVSSDEQVNDLYDYLMVVSDNIQDTVLDADMLGVFRNFTKRVSK
jgi:hypothetical protein